MPVTSKCLFLISFYISRNEPLQKKFDLDITMEYSQKDFENAEVEAAEGEAFC